MKKQIKILNEIASILHHSSIHDYDSACIEYKFNTNENWNSISFWYTREGRNFSSEDFDIKSNQIKKLCEELHSEMYAQTGGDWRKFILTLDENGEAKTQFIYEVQSCMDEFDED